MTDLIERVRNAAEEIDKSISDIRKSMNQRYVSENCYEKLDAEIKGCRSALNILYREFPEIDPKRS